MQDIPIYTQQTFILYSAATGATAQALEEGIEPGHIRQTCEVNSQTPMVIDGVVFDKSGLKITPVLSDDGLHCSFDIKITKCDFFLSDGFSLTFTTEGDENVELEGVELTVRFKVICYGCDRPYLVNNFVEKNCAVDPLVSRQSVVPVSVNSLASLHIHELNVENSGIAVYDNDADKGENVVYYNWAPGDTGAFGIAVEGVTYEGNHGVGTVDSYPFPQGRGADVLIIANYPDYYAPGYTCALAPAGAVQMPEYALYGGVMGQYGGAFEAVPGDDGKPQYWLHQYEDKPSDNTTYHVDHKIYSSSNEWILQSCSYIDNADSEWKTIATAPMATLTIPAIDDGKKVTLEGVYSLPPFSGWKDTDLADAALTVSGDGKYFTKERRFLNTVNISSTDGDFTEFPVYAGHGGVMYRTEKQTYEVTENGETRTAELILFPDAQGWQISSGGTVLANVQPQETTQAAVTYAPPRRDDTAFTTAAKMTQEISGAIVETPVPMAFNNDLGGMLITAGDTAGGLWKRYPYHRLVDSNLNISAKLKLKNATDGDYIKEDVSEYISWGEEAPNGGASYYPNFFDLSTEDVISSYVAKNASTRERGATVTVEVPLDGLVQGGEAVRSFAGLTKDPEIEVNYVGASNSAVDKYGYGRSWRHFEWVNKDTTREVTLGGEVKTIPVTSGFQELKETASVDAEYSERITTEAHEETGTGGKKSGTGYADCYLHIGQSDVEGGWRMTTQAASYGGRISAEIPVTVKDIYTVEVDGELTEDNTTTENTTATAGVDVARAEAYPRFALPNHIGSDRTPDTDSSASGDYSINITARKTTAYTGGNWERNLENTYICDGRHVVSWKDDDGEWHESTFPIKCYALTGTASKTEHTLYKSYGGTASFAVKNGIATCTCSAYAELDLSSTASWLLTETATKYPDGTPSIDQEYPVNQSSRWDKGNSTIQKLTGAQTLKVEHTGDGKFKITRTFAPDGYYTYTNDPHKTEEENNASYRFEWRDHNDIVYDGNSGEEPPTITEVKEDVTLSVKAVREIFDDFVSQLPQRGEEIEPPQEDWQYGRAYADYTDSPLYAVSGDGCTIFYEESSSEPKPGKCSASFVTVV